MAAEVIRPAPKRVASFDLDANQVLSTFNEDALWDMSPAQRRAVHDSLGLVQLHIERIDLLARMRAPAPIDP